MSAPPLPHVMAGGLLEIDMFAGAVIVKIRLSEGERQILELTFKDARELADWLHRAAGDAQAWMRERSGPACEGGAS